MATVPKVSFFISASVKDTENIEKVNRAEQTTEMKELRMRKIGFLAFSLLFSIDGMTHDLFLRPASFVLAEPGELKLSMWLAEAFPGREQKWRSDKTGSTIVKGPAGLQKIPNVTDVSATVSLKQDGSYVIGWEGTESYIKIDAATFNKYLEAEYKNVLQMRKQRGDEQKEGTEKYFRY